MLPLPLPLIRVLDLTTSVAGASASRALADFGAEVIVVERPGTPRDAMERYGRNKFSCVIDPTAAEAGDLLLRLAATCNAVLKDGPDEALAGLDYDALRAVRDDVVLAVIADGGERPGIGNVTAGAVMTALFYVRYRGKGQQVTISFPAAGASMRTAPVVAAAAGVAQLTPDLPPSGCYACADGSIAVVVRSIDELATLGDVIARPELADAVTGGAELPDAVAAWTAGRATHAAATELREHGMAAQPLLAPDGLRDDPHLRARGVFEPVAAGAGVIETDGPRIRFSDTPLHTRFAAPAPGEHTRYVLRDLIGLSGAEIEGLAASGVVSGVIAGAQ
jgi:crotonobetainyl-CoA:carnitine CoA-transferase CaiB-like acyl-CoA transferase